jgi:endonuclease/exonuclease/phosphatase family metal-dependent hydrolase
MRIFLFTINIFVSITLFSQSAPIIIDGLFDDWTTDLTTYTDPIASVSGIDLLEMQVTNDEEYLYIKLITDTEFDLTTNLVSQGLMLYLDTDNDPTTGYAIQNGYGSELGVKFKERFAYYNVAPYSQVSFADIRLIPAPTVTSNTFEIAIALDVIPDGVNPLFTSSTIRILFKDINSGDSMPDINEVFYYTFDESPPPPVDLYDIDKQDNNHIRVVAYNTLFNGLDDPDRVAFFENIIKALKPDIIGFSECGDTNPYDVKALLDNWLPLGTSDGWYVANDTTGDLVTVSKWKILQYWQSLYRQFPVLIDLPDSYHTNLLFTNAHLRCCGANTERQAQVDEYIAFMLDAHVTGGAISLQENTPFVYAGDLNLVGYAQQLTTLVTGAIQNTATYGVGGPYDWDDTEVTDQICRQTDKRMAYTWKDDSSSYPEGRLDYMIFSDAVMQAKKSFSLQTEVMSTERLQEYGLLEYATSNASDHFPVVCDFLPNTSIGYFDLDKSVYNIYPNPIADYLLIDFINKGYHQVQIFDAKGILLYSKYSLSKKIKIDTNKLKSGLYFLSIKDENNKLFRTKFIKK